MNHYYAEDIAKSPRIGQLIRALVREDACYRGGSCGSSYRIL